MTSAASARLRRAFGPRPVVLTGVSSGASAWVWALASTVGVLGVGAGSAAAQAPSNAFTNWETPHVHPIELTPDGTKLLAVNTADNRLEVYAVSGGGGGVRVLTPLASIPVGLDPVTVRARTSGEAWVVNHISDSISIVDLNLMTVRRTIKTQDEPCDVVFAGPGGDATQAFVSCQAPHVVQVFSASAPALPVSTISIIGESPRSLAVSPDGAQVYCAIFDSGNNTTILGGGSLNLGAGNLAFPPNAVSDPVGPYAGVNPPPNAGTGFSPARSAAASTNLPVGLIVRKDSAGRWFDDNNRDWTSLVSGANAARSGRPVGWDLADHDCAIIDASSLSVSYSRGLMNICMSVGVNPVTGVVTVIGTEATNEVRFEPNVNGVFVRVKMGSFSPAAPLGGPVIDLNPHLSYAVRTLPLAQRGESIGDPRAIIWDSTGLRGYIAGMGSNNIITIDQGGQRFGALAPLAVGEGPTGLALHEASGTLFVMNKFGASISVIDTAAWSEAVRVPLHDSTPTAIKVGRKHLYDTQKNSGLGQASCGSCHVDARNDRLAWDLGDPTGASGSLANRNLGMGFPGLAPATTNVAFQPFHPMKGPMTTQTMQDIIGKEPHHWRGDRLGIEEFNGAFVGLQANDVVLTPAEMQQFEDFLASITFPPNPFRNFNNTLPTSLPLPGHFTTGRFGPAGRPLPNGNAQNGLALYRSTNRRLDSNAFACVTCHTLPTGAGPDMTFSGAQWIPIPAGPRGERHLGLVSVDGSTNTSIKIPQTRQLYKKVGFNTTQLINTSGFGVLHDGSVDSIERFVAEPVFTLASDQEVADMVALLLAFSGSDMPLGSPTNVFIPPGPLSKDSRAGVGVQVTIDSTGDAPAITLLGQMVAEANAGRLALVAKGRWAAPGGPVLPRGAFYAGGGNFQTDRRAEILTQAQLLALAGPETPITFTVVPTANQQRIGADRDSDGFFDRDELDVCSNPADKNNFPGSRGSVDFNGDLRVDPDDLSDFISAFFAIPADPRADFSGDGNVDPDDLSDYITRYFSGC